MNDDAALLRRYADEKSEPAFAELVHRHLDLVYSAALRRLGGDAHRAADVAQQVFTTLARDAKKLSGHTVLTAWLYTATRHAAIDVIRAEQRRSAREQEASTMHTLMSATPDAEWEKLRPVLDEVMDELSDTDRAAVLMRFFEQRPFAEVGAALDLSEDAARMRVDRALDKLHALLARRGVTSTSAALATALANQAVAIAPAGLAASVTGAALTGVTAAGVGSLATALYFMSATKLTLSIAAAGALAIGVAVYQSSQARTLAAAVTEASRGNAALAARFAELEASVNLAEKEQAEREAALSRRRAEPAAMAAKPASIDDINAKYRKLVSQLTKNDAELKKATAVNRRLRSKESYRPLFASMALSPEQVEQALDILSDNTTSVAAKREGIEARFGAEAAVKFDRFERASRERDFVKDFTNQIFFTDEPLTAPQVEQLSRIVAEASPPLTAPRDYGYEAYEGFMRDYQRSLDWEKILAQAGPVLSPAQFQGLRGMAATARNDALLATAAKAVTSPKP